MKNKIIVSAITALILSGCGSEGGSGKTSTTPPTTSNVIKDLGFLKIEKTPSNFKKYEDKGYKRYVGYKAPNGKNIHILIQDKISEFQIARSYNILKHYLTTDPTFAYDKSEVANKMANNNAILKLQNGTHSEDNEDDLWGQPLYENEMQVEGGDWYMKQDYNHRDASYEEILHLVHDFGFGVLNSGTGIDGATPQLQLGINNYQKSAYANSFWTPEDDEYKEWKDEISLDQEYFASVIDAYYGLWGAWNDTSRPNTSMWGIYKMKDRSSFSSSGIRDGVSELVKQVFHPTLQYTAYMSDKLSGEFSMRFDSSKPYTNHSQYLTKIKLNGKNNVKVILNKNVNFVTGNEGHTTVVLQGTESDYSIAYDKKTNEPIAVMGLGKYQAIDGNNELRNVDKLEFLNN
ncbi:hypothetical protein [Vibrio splendidus]|uniref:hypothetical protein n=1 Tax=Vibrio splendidus TaxID=29497 RepID=UPI00076AAC1A|nr:hypothetical protein [Vibrio splendidus]PHX04339.1 hypothetical protein VSPL_41120 [Vibrio splendidus]